MTKERLLDALRSSGDDAVAKVDALDPAALEQGRYENGWNARQILAHIASIEWTYARLPDLAKQSAPTPPASSSGEVRRTTVAEAPGVPTRPPQLSIDDYNERQVGKRAEAPVAELIAEFERNRAQTIAAVEAADDILFEREIRSAGGVTGSLADVINVVAVQHVRAHVRDIVGGT